MINESQLETNHMKRTAMFLVLALLASSVTAQDKKKGPQVGDKVPEISGPDTDGVVFKLSDYKGKVILIDFWGDW